MKLSYSFNIDKNNSLMELCKVSKELYNQALYEIKTALQNENKFLFYNDLERIMKTKTNLEGNINYRLLKTQVSQQILMLLDKDIKSYYKSYKEYKKNPNKFKGIPKLPNYKPKYNLLMYSNQSATIKNEYINLSKTLKIKIPQYDKYKELIKNFQQIRIIPKQTFIKVEIVYNYDIQNKNLNQDEYSSIDLGINNLATLVTKNNTLLFNGKPIKSINQYGNKKLSRLKSIKDKQKLKFTKRIQKIWEKRENKLNDEFHKLSKYIINHLIKNKIGNLIVGYNKNWKDSINLGKKTNQKFVMIPYLKFINYLKYKCEMVGIKLILNEESYTSKVDSLANEPLEKRDIYLGKRVKRGLFQSSIGKLINADINGALNIMRKVVNDSYINEIVDRGLLFNPIKIRNYSRYDSNFLLKNQNNNFN